jgi:hypothetical protein
LKSPTPRQSQTLYVKPRLSYNELHNIDHSTMKTAVAKKRHPACQPALGSARKPGIASFLRPLLSSLLLSAFVMAALVVALAISTVSALIF